MIRECLYWPRDDEGAYRRGFQLSILAGLGRVAIGWSLERHPREWTFQLFLGPVTLMLWRPKP